MRKAYKNQIFQYLLNHPLGIDNFEVTDDETSFRLTYKLTEIPFTFSFEASGDFDYVWPTAVLFEPFFKHQELSQDAVPFESAFEYFKGWIDQHLQEYINDCNEIDLWAEYKARVSALPSNEFDYQDHTTFTKHEKQSIKLALKELSQLILDRFVEDEKHQQIVEERLAYLAESIDRIDHKIDWKGILINTIISITIALTLDPERGQELYNLFVQVLQVFPQLGK
jgi:hypothetical protein